MDPFHPSNYTKTQKMTWCDMPGDARNRTYLTRGTCGQRRGRLSQGILFLSFHTRSNRGKGKRNTIMKTTLPLPQQILNSLQIQSFPPGNWKMIQAMTWHKYDRGLKEGGPPERVRNSVVSTAQWIEHKILNGNFGGIPTLVISPEPTLRKGN